MTSSDDVKWSKKIKDCFPAFAKNRSNLGPWILDLGSALLHAHIRTGIGTSRGCHMSAEGTGPAEGAGPFLQQQLRALKNSSVELYAQDG